MPTIEYQSEFQYAHDVDGKRYPRLEFRVSSSLRPEEGVEVEAYLDSGTERSLFGGWIGTYLGIDVLRGPRLVYATTTGSRLTATLHVVRLSHPQLGDFDLEVGFSSGEIHRNLLGRDFFNLTQIGFRERHLTFFITSSP